jgi:hypothetical protein
VQNNVVYPYYVELTMGLPAGSPKSVEKQVDLIFAILTERLDLSAESPSPEASAPVPLVSPHAAEPRSGDTVVYARKEGRGGASESNRSKQLEIENLHLKQLVGSLSLENKVLLERLTALEPAAARE